MNINNMRNIAIYGQIASLKAQILAWEVWAKRTEEDASSVITAKNTQISELEKRLT